MRDPDTGTMNSVENSHLLGKMRTLEKSMDDQEAVSLPGNAL
jgi:hypothetical protein